MPIIGSLSTAAAASGLPWKCGGSSGLAGWPALPRPTTLLPVRPGTTALLPPRSYGKPVAAAAVDRLPMMGIRMPETC
jgi:hypothetical protein